MTLGPLSFTTPWLLTALLLLPLLWAILRLPRPHSPPLFFPALILLRHLKTPPPTPEKSPWWLTALRCVIFSLLIISFSGPHLSTGSESKPERPLLIITDASWASAPTWQSQRAQALEWIARNHPSTQPAAILNLNAPQASALTFHPISDIANRLEQTSPNPWTPDYAQFIDILTQHNGAYDTLWLSDRIERPHRVELYAAASTKGSVYILEPQAPLYILRPAQLNADSITISAERLSTQTASPSARVIRAIGLGPAGQERELSKAPLSDFAPTAQRHITAATAKFDLPASLRNRITRFELHPATSAAHVSLTNTQLQSRSTALMSHPKEQTAKLLSSQHYITQALAPVSEIITAPLLDILLENPRSLILDDIAYLSDKQSEQLLAWVNAGGHLIRFSGPNIAAMAEGSQQDASTAMELFPVDIRFGGRDMSSALSWDTPQRLVPFSQTSPFYGLTLPGDVTISQQIIATPAPHLKERTIAQLEDTTPLITQKASGKGRITLFHIAATPDWSSLPISGLFVDMLDRLTQTHGSSTLKEADIAALTWSPHKIIQANGEYTDPKRQYSVDGDRLIDPSAHEYPGIYHSQAQTIVRQTITQETAFTPAEWPNDAQLITQAQSQSIHSLTALAFGLCGLLFLLESLISLQLHRRNQLPLSSIVVLMCAMSLTLAPQKSHAQNLLQPDVPTLAAANNPTVSAAEHTLLAYVKTGELAIDQTSHAGLLGLSRALFARTTVEPLQPIGINLEQDDISLLTFLYWPLQPAQPQLSPQAIEKLSAYIKTGGLILFDTQDADTAIIQRNSSLTALNRNMQFPALEPLTPQHPLSYSFYLLDRFPGRYDSGPVWVQLTEDVSLKSSQSATDQVSPIVIGGHEWAKAWAQDDSGAWLYPVGRGRQGQRQRELALRFGINLVLYALSGNYKQDQRQLPALLEKLPSTFKD